MVNAVRLRLLGYLLVSAVSFFVLVMPERAGFSVMVFAVVQLACVYFLAPKKKPLLMFVPLFVMAANMAGVDITRLPPAEGRMTGEETVKRAPEVIARHRMFAPQIHINYVTNTCAFANKEDALKNFSEFIASGADSVLPMGINNETLKFVSDNYAIVFGHVGALSGWQTMGNYGGYRRMGKTAEEAMKVFRQAYEYQENGMKGMTLELTSIEVSNAIAKKLRVPVIGIAAGGACDGTEMVDMDTFGMVAGAAGHAKAYGNFLKFAFEVYSAFIKDVETGGYPQEEHGWKMDATELDKFMNEIEKG